MGGKASCLFGRHHPQIGGIPNAIGGDSDHVHVLARLKATHCVADVMRELKSSSSAWIHNEIGIRIFEWQDGYGAFTVSSSAVDSVQGYIEKQKEHPKRKSFQEEYLELLRESGIEFDERYLWGFISFFRPSRAVFSATLPGVRCAHPRLCSEAALRLKIAGQQIPAGYF